MTPSVRAAVQYEANGPLVIEKVDLELPRDGEVRVKFVASGVCASDLSVAQGHQPHARPLILGHEGAGIVEDVGPGVTHVAPGDPVIVGLAAHCGTCRWCLQGRPILCNGPVMRAASVGILPDGTTRVRHRGEALRQYRGVGTFAESAIVWGAQCVPVAETVPLEKVCLIGCAVLTGVGAAINTTKVQPGSACVVIGCGGVGLNVIQGCRIAGAATIIAVDINPQKLELAAAFGATHQIDASRQDVAPAVRRLTHGGADYAFEVIGRTETMEQAFAATARGGTCCVVGLAPPTLKIQVGAYDLLSEKVLTGSFYGSSQPLRDIPILIDWYSQGRLHVDELVSQTLSLDGVNEAFQAFEEGTVARTVLVYR